MRPIPHRVRLQLGLKAVGLLVIALSLLAISLGGVASSWSIPLRALFASFFFLVSLFPLGVSRFALFDAVLGRAVEVKGAIALDEQQRRAGWSLKLPDGHFAEFLFANRGAPLVPGLRYTVVIGVHSRVLVEPPSPE